MTRVSSRVVGASPSKKPRGQERELPTEPVTVSGEQAPAGRVTRRRDKMSPDPDVRRAILTAASELIREQGVRGLSVADVLDRCHLSTRAFYRHFETKDQLVAAVFREAATTEMRRLRRKMKASKTAADAVASWIDGRLDLAFNKRIGTNLRQVSIEAQSLMFTSPELVEAAFGIMLRPLVEQLERGLRDGEFRDIDPTQDAEIIQGVVWACTERRWLTVDNDRADVRKRVQRACLRALGAAPEVIAGVVAARSDH